MNYNIEKDEKYTHLSIQETKVDALISNTLKGVFGENTETKNWILDLEDVKYVDSSGLSAILIGNRQAKDNNGEFVLTAVSEHVMKLIKISQLDRVLTILPTVEEAVDFIFMSELEKELNEGDEI